MKNIDYIELNASAFVYSCTIGQVHLLVCYKGRIHVFANDKLLINLLASAYLHSGIAIYLAMHDIHSYS